MRFCLCKPTLRVQQAAACLATLALFGACGGTSFTASGASGSGGAAGSGGDTPDVAGEAGSAEAGRSGGSNGGSAGGEPSAGAAGKGTPPECDCAPGNYCQDGTNKCRACSDFSRLEFGAKQKLTTLAQSAGSIERFPRPGKAPSSMFYTSGAPDKVQIWYAPTPVSGVGSPASGANAVESGPLYAPGFFEGDFFFDRVVNLGNNHRKLFVGTLGVTGLTGVMAAPAPYNMAGFDDYSIAVAPTVARAYWMSTRGGAPELYWQSPSATPPIPPAVLDLMVNVSCARAGDDATPWVNLAGTVLLFRSRSLNADCEPNDSGAYDLFAVPLNKDGIAATPAVPLSSLNNTGGSSTETDPSLSQDACTVYFASDGGTGDFDLYRASRQ